MGTKNTGRVTIRDINPSLRKAIKKEAVDRGILVNDLYLKIIESGAKRLRIVIEG